MNLSIPGEKDTGGFADPTFVQVTEFGFWKRVSILFRIT